jgi:hypothetical protein
LEIRSKELDMEAIRAARVFWVTVVVGRYASGGYEVEFAAADGSTIAVVTLADDDIRPRRRREILRVGQIA